MAAGGYIYEQADVAYGADGNDATMRTWALAIHLTRCKAFMAAASREETSFGGAGWESVQTNTSYLETKDTSTGYDIWYQDIHPSSVDTNGDYPAFVTFFRCKNTDHSEYCILTYSGFNCYADYSDQSIYYGYGLYIPKTSVLGASGYSYVYCGQSMAHAFAKTGFGSYDVCNASCITTDCTAIMAAYCKTSGYESSYIVDSNSLIYSKSADPSYLTGYTFQFGFAIRGEQIIAIERRSDASYWNWSIIGDIVKTTIATGDTHTIGGVTNDYSTNEVSESVSSLSSTPMLYGISFSKTDGTLYKPSTYDESIVVDMNRSYSSWYGLGGMCIRTSTQSPTDTRYNSVFIGATYTAWSSSCIDGGVDGDGNGCKGFLDTDIIRQVSAGVCQSNGATFQSGNFVAMKYPYSSMVGFLLGWDASNASIM